MCSKNSGANDSIGTQIYTTEEKKKMDGKISSLQYNIENALSRNWIALTPWTLCGDGFAISAVKFAIIKLYVPKRR